MRGGDKVMGDVMMECEKRMGEMEEEQSKSSCSFRLRKRPPRQRRKERPQDLRIRAERIHHRD
jgi:hypothetical protein